MVESSFKIWRGEKYPYKHFITIDLEIDARDIVLLREKDKKILGFLEDSDVEAFDKIKLLELLIRRLKKLRDDI